MKDNHFTGRVTAPVARHPGDSDAVKVEYALPPKRKGRGRLLALAAWLGGPAFAYLTGGLTQLLVYLVLLGVFCLLRDSWWILRGRR